MRLFGLGQVRGHRVGVQTVKPSAVESDPVDTAMRFNHAMRVGRSRTDSVINKAVSIKAAYSITSAKPDIAVRVANEIIYGTTPQSVGGRINLDGQTFGVNDARYGEQNCEQ